jgi:uncharacterized protein YcfJ
VWLRICARFPFFRTSGAIPAPDLAIRVCEIIFYASNIQVSFGKDGVVRKVLKSNISASAAPGDCGGHLIDSLWRKLETMDSLKRYVVLIGLVLALAACAQQRPVLYPNAHLKYVGKEIAEADTEECIQMAIDYGAREDKGGRVAKDTAKGAAVGGAAGTAVGAVTGNAGRGAAAGAAGGGAASMTRSMLNSDKPDAVFKKFVERCLRDKGYQPIGWR